MRLTAFCPFIVCVLAGCAARTAVPPAARAPDTDECRQMKEVCDQALQFQAQYETLPEDEKKDMVSVLNTYIEHCEKATVACEQGPARRNSSVPANR